MLNLRRKEAGDSIIEVLIATAIISLVLASAYVISNRNAMAVQGTQERLEAQHLSQAQIEVLRSQGGITTSGSCFKGLTETTTCDDFTRSGSGATYLVEITGPVGINHPSPSNYVVHVRWTSPGADKNNDSSVSTVYRLN